ncbi:MAG TPA: cytochrome b/b6 domain-containing protein [Gaiellales bacterium]|nr:cytochrome b/b6 domain-containing protein [Gaiellales bacterium]
MTRFSAFERALHWLLALTFLTMAATGLILYLPSLAEVAANRGMWKSIHLGAAIAFWAGLIALLPGNGRQFRASAREIDRFDGDDRRWLQWAVTRRGDEPVQGRFNAGQKLNTAIVSGLMVVFTVSGTLMYLQETDAAFRGRTSAILVHDLATWVALPLVAGHLWLALVNPSTRHSMRGILLGSVRRDWARRHHGKWMDAVEGQPVSTGSAEPPSPSP